jgi:hypothetical protein
VAWAASLSLGRRWSSSVGTRRPGTESSMPARKRGGAEGLRVRAACLPGEWGRSMCSVGEFECGIESSMGIETKVGVGGGVQSGWGWGRGLRRRADHG